MLNSIIGLLNGGGAAGGGSSFESIATVTTANATTQTISFSSIPSTYKHLQIRVLAGNAINAPDFYMRFNSDTGSNYASHHLYGDGTTVYADGSATQAQISLLGTSSGSSTYLMGMINDIQDYASTSKYKTSKTIAGFDKNGSGTIGLGSGLWMSTSAISTITILTSNASLYFNNGATFALYGIKG